MVDIQARTRAQLRAAVGDNLGAYRPGRKGTGGSATAWIDLRFVGDGESTYVGWWVVFTSLVNIGMIRIVDTFDSSSGQFQLRAQTTATSNMNTHSAFFELWEKRYPPDRIHRFLNQAILELTGKAFDPVESLALRLDGTSQRFDIPTGMSMIQNVYYRDSVDSTRLLSCNSAFDEHSTLVATTLDGAITSTSATSVPVASSTPLRANQQIMVGSEKMTISSISSNTLTVSREAGETTAATHSDGASVLLFPVVDTKINKEGTASNQFVIPAAASADQIATDSISSKDISRYDYLEGWIKITRAGEATTTAADLAILLDDTANCASPLEELDIPALTDDTWTFFRVKLANPELDTAIISIGLKYDVDLGACTIWLDDIKVVKNDSAQWERIPRSSWRIDKEDKAIVFDNSVHGISGEAPLKLVGGGKPALLSLAETSDGETSATEVDDRFVIARATALALAAAGPRSTRGDDVNFHRGQLSFWQREAEMAKRALPFLVDVRHSGA